MQEDFFEKYGLYDPHIILRRTWDWDLWRRSLKLGASIRHVRATVGVEHGMVSPVSLGNTVHLDFKLSTAYAFDDRNLIKRLSLLLPHTIHEYDILDSEKILPYVRDLKEWEAIERNIYHPFLECHPEYQYEPMIRHNRRYDTGINGYALNPPMAVFKKRQRVLLLGNRYNRLMKDWYDALASDPNLIVVTCAEGGLSFFSTDDLDFLILFDCCLVVDRKIEEFQKQGTCVIFAVDHGLDDNQTAGDPIQLLHLKNYTSADTFVMNHYFPTNGYPWPPHAKEVANAMMRQSDQVFSMQPEREDACLVRFFPNSVNYPVTIEKNWPEEVALYMGYPENIRPDLIQKLAGGLQTRNCTLYLLEGADLSELWASLFPGWKMKIVNDSLFTLLAKGKNTCFFVPDTVRANT